MKRSSQVAAPLLAATAIAMMTSCHKPEMRRCVDQQLTVVDDDLCQNPNEARVRDGTLSPFRPNYRFYYGGDGTRQQRTHASNGSFMPLSGHSYDKPRSSSTARGGFGATFGPWLVLGAGVGVLVFLGVGE